jgi:hypothetical protein
MSREGYKQIIDEAYKNYLIEDAKILPNMSKEKMTDFGYGLSIEEFINKCKTDPGFSENQGLKINDKELSIEEREMYWRNNMGMKGIQFMLYSLYGEEGLHKEYDKQNVPRILITITHNNEKIEIYE